jgi:hypothetical protein
MSAGPAVEQELEPEPALAVALALEWGQDSGPKPAPRAGDHSAEWWSKTHRTQCPPG